MCLKISYFLVPIELYFQRNVLSCWSEKINDATIEFKYKSYSTCNAINVVRLASLVTSSEQKISDMIVKKSHIFKQKTLVSRPKFPTFWRPSSTLFTQYFELLVSKINDATTDFWYRSYRTYDAVNVVCFVNHVTQILK